MAPIHLRTIAPILWWGSLQPIFHNRSSQPTKGLLRLVAFNAMGGVNFDGIVTCFRCEPLKSASVILLSEVDYGTLRVGRRKVAKELADELGMSCAFSLEFGLRRGNGEIRAFLGNAILSREPLHNVFPIALPNLTEGSELTRRALRGYQRVDSANAMAATVSVNGKPLSICVVHLDSRSDPASRDAQIAAVLDQIPPEGPAVIGGDFNTTTVALWERNATARLIREMLRNPRRFQSPESYEPLFRRLRDARFEIKGVNAEGRPTFTFARLIPPLFRPRLDWITVRELRPVPGSAEVIAARTGFFSRRVSDHDFISVDVAI